MKPVAPAESDPVFVVGVPRSGTTLLAAMLGSHPDFSCGPETHFFCALSERPGAVEGMGRHWPEEGVRFLCSIRHLGQPVVGNYGLTPAQLQRHLRKRPPALPALLEKVWLPYDDSSSAFFLRDPGCHSLRLEDLLSDPEPTLKGLCAWLGVPFTQEMLRPSGASLHLNRTGEPWKRRVGQPLDASHVGGWRELLTDGEVGEAARLLGDRLRRYGYPLTRDEPLGQADWSRDATSRG